MLGLTLILLIASSWMAISVEKAAKEEVLKTAREDISHLASTSRSTVMCADESLRSKVANNMQVAKDVLSHSGKVTLSGQNNVTAINQFTKTPMSISVPVLSFGGKAITPNTDPNKRTVIVDEIAGLVGGYATVFLRINKNGDMLRVATNVVAKTGKRAVGTYIPAINPDGKPNPVVSNLVKGNNYIGVAYVVDKWCVSEYSPIKDSLGNVIGAIFVGIQQESVPALRNAITSQKVGTSGYIWVLSTKPETMGHYVISKEGKRDGEDILNTKDANGASVISDMIAKGMKSSNGETVHHAYMWKNEDDKAPRKKIVAITYYEPWGWLIGAGAYEDEFLAPIQNLKVARARSMAIVILAALGCLAVAGYWFSSYASQLSSRINTITKIAQATAEGDVETASRLLGASDKAA